MGDTPVMQTTDVEGSGSAAPDDRAPTAPAAPTIDPFERKAELIAAVLLSIATVVTAWSAFQATKWSGEMAIEFSDANAARTESAEARAVAGQLTEIDVTVFTQWVAAYADGDQRLADAYADRFRDDFKPAFEAWIAQDPLDNPDAPAVPFELDEYDLPEEHEADRLTDEADAAGVRAREANQRGDNYVLTTVLFASVLFFAGVSNKFDSRRAKTITLAMGSALLALGVVLILTFPIRI